jgi:hypothetical protein
MKRLLVLMLAAVFLFSGAAFAADVKDKRGEEVKAKSGGDAQTKGTKEGAPKAIKMKTTGTVLAISDGAMKLEKAGKDKKKEAMDFFLVKAFPEIKAGDKVNVTYVKKDGKNVAEAVSKVKEKTAKPPAAKKSAEPGPPAKDKRGEDVKAKSGGDVDTKKK